MKGKTPTLLIGCSLWVAGALADPLADFQKIVTNCRQAYDSRPNTEVAFSPSAKVWIKRVRTPAEISYDVKKTDSLVSPYAAFILVIDGSASLHAQDQASAAVLEPSLADGLFVARTKLNFAYTDKKWVLAEATMGSNLKGSEGPTIALKPSQMQGPGGAISSCIR
jgi:hypothetical protein